MKMLTFMATPSTTGSITLLCMSMTSSTSAIWNTAADQGSEGRCPCVSAM